MEEGTCIQYTWCILGRMPHSVQIAHHAPTRRYSFLRILWSSKHTIVKQFPFWKALAKSKDSAAWIKVKLSIAVEYMCVFFNFRHHWLLQYWVLHYCTSPHRHTHINNTHVHSFHCHWARLSPFIHILLLSSFSCLSCGRWRTISMMNERSHEAFVNQTALYL